MYVYIREYIYYLVSLVFSSLFREDVHVGRMVEGVGSREARACDFTFFAQIVENRETRLSSPFIGPGDNFSKSYDTEYTSMFTKLGKNAFILIPLRKLLYKFEAPFPTGNA